MQYLNQVFSGDCLDVLHKIPSNYIHCCVTSPPYWGLRDYGTRRWFNHSPDCPHVNRAILGPHHTGQVEQSKWSNVKSVGHGQTATTESCLDCGGWWGQLGLESNPNRYIDHLVEVFQEIKRVLHPRGTLWLNLGDSYAGTNEGEGIDSLVEPKNLLGIPWRTALALQQDGWYLRSEVIWYKPNCLPESVMDRPTESHEHLFLLSKSPNYFYDKYAVEDDTGNTPRNRRSVWSINTKPYSGAHFAVFPEELPSLCIRASTSHLGAYLECNEPIRVAEQSCKCQKGSTPCRVLDPFAGSGTTLAVAQSLGRDYIGIEANVDYLPLIQERLRDPDVSYQSILDEISLS